MNSCREEYFFDLFDHCYCCYKLTIVLLLSNSGNSSLLHINNNSAYH